MEGEQLKRRKVRMIDIANDKWTDKYEAAEDPKIIKSEKVNRGPLNSADWIVSCNWKFFLLEKL